MRQKKNRPKAAYMCDPVSGGDDLASYFNGGVKSLARSL
jgi:pyridoxal/pyridoxine/pyridoxamine kinase